VAAARDIVESWPPRLRIRHPLPASPVAAPVARRLLDRACEAWEVTDLIEPAELVITELVANAVRYAANGVLLTISLRQGQLQISVSDDSPARPRPGVAGRSDEHGRGLALVEAVSIDWGTACISDGKVVWAKVAAPSR
jgi:anti-sigma regulatory factor (Ser/Thr protein kinase)